MLVVTKRMTRKKCKDKYLFAVIVVCVVYCSILFVACSHVLLHNNPLSYSNTLQYPSHLTMSKVSAIDEINTRVIFITGGVIRERVKMELVYYRR